MNHLENEILKNKDDLVEGTFCFELFEEKTFNTPLFDRLIRDIQTALKSTDAKSSNKLKEFIIWFTMGTIRCVICHNNPNDLYKISDFSMDAWNESYEPKLNSTLLALIKT